MPNTHALKASIILVVMALSSCAKTTTPDQTAQHKALNQPQVDLITPMNTTSKNGNEATKVFPITNSVVNKKENKLTSTNTSKTDTPIQKSGLFDSNWGQLKRSVVVKAFEMKDGETHRTTLTKWLNSMGYRNVEFVLTKSDSSMLENRASRDLIFFETLPLALEQLTEMVVRQQEAVTDSNGLYVSFDDRDATIYSATPQLIIHKEGQALANKSRKSPLALFKGETYEAAIMRWLNEEGFQRFGKLVNDDTQQVLSQTIPNTESINEPFEKATTLLLYRAREQALSDTRNERENFLSDTAKADIEHHLYLNTERKEAILTSSNQPVVMFNVEPGPLKDNFLRLSKAFGWKASESHFMAQEYRVDFGYPIVAEKGNIKSALNSLLIDFSRLYGGIVPSTREAYVLMEQ